MRACVHEKTCELSYLLRIVREIRQHGADVIHNLEALEGCVHTLLACAVICNNGKFEKKKNIKKMNYWRYFVYGNKKLKNEWGTFRV